MIRLDSRGVETVMDVVERRKRHRLRNGRKGGGVFPALVTFHELVAGGQLDTGCNHF